MEITKPALKVVELDTGCVIRAVVDGLEDDVVICYNGVGTTHVFDNDTFYNPLLRKEMYDAMGEAVKSAIQKPVSLEPGSIALMDAYQAALAQVEVVKQQLIERLRKHHGISFSDGCFATGKLIHDEDGDILYYQGSIPLTPKEKGSNVYLFPSREDDIGEEDLVLDLDHGQNKQEHRLFCFLSDRVTV